MSMSRKGSSPISLRERYGDMSASGDKRHHQQSPPTEHDYNFQFPIQAEIDPFAPSPSPINPTRSRNFSQRSRGTSTYTNNAEFSSLFSPDLLYLPNPPSPTYHDPINRPSAQQFKQWSRPKSPESVKSWKTPPSSFTMNRADSESTVGEVIGSVRMMRGRSSNNRLKDSFLFQNDKTLNAMAEKVESELINELPTLIPIEKVYSSVDSVVTYSTRSNKEKEKPLPDFAPQSKFDGFSRTSNSSFGAEEMGSVSQKNHARSSSIEIKGSSATSRMLKSRRISISHSTSMEEDQEDDDTQISIHRKLEKKVIIQHVPTFILILLAVIVSFQSIQTSPASKFLTSSIPSISALILLSLTYLPLNFPFSIPIHCLRILGPSALQLENQSLTGVKLWNVLLLNLFFISLAISVIKHYPIAPSLFGRQHSPPSPVHPPQSQSTSPPPGDRPFVSPSIFHSPCHAWVSEKVKQAQEARKSKAQSLSRKIAITIILSSYLLLTLILNVSVVSINQPKSFVNTQWLQTLWTTVVAGTLLSVEIMVMMEIGKDESKSVVDTEVNESRGNIRRSRIWGLQLGDGTWAVKTCLAILVGAVTLVQDSAKTEGDGEVIGTLRFFGNLGTVFGALGVLLVVGFGEWVLLRRSKGVGIWPLPGNRSMLKIMKSFEEKIRKFVANRWQGPIILRTNNLPVAIVRRDKGKREMVY